MSKDEIDATRDADSITASNIDELEAALYADDFDGTDNEQTDDDSSVQSKSGISPMQKLREKVSGIFGKKVVRNKGTGTGSNLPVPSVMDDTVTSSQSQRNSTSAKKLTKNAVPPIQLLLGWIGDSTPKDVYEHAKGFAADHLETLETAWVAIAPLCGGYIFEVHEGGAGLSYLPGIIEKLNRNPDQTLWMPSGTKQNKVTTIAIFEGRPYSTILTDDDSLKVRSSGQLPIEMSGRMRRMIPKGVKTLAVGCGFAAVGTITLCAVLYYGQNLNQQPISSLPYSSEALPHGQIIKLSESLREERWVSKIVFDEGQWRAEFEAFEITILPEDDKGAQAVVDAMIEQDSDDQQRMNDKIMKLDHEVVE